MISESVSTEYKCIIRPHCPIMCVDAVYCHQPSTMVCQSVGLCVTLVSPAKLAEPIEMQFGLCAQMVPRNHLLDGGPDSHGNGQFWGKGRLL